MAKKRSETWGRGAPRAESVSAGTGGTADVDLAGARTVEGTSDRAAPPGGPFTPISSRDATPRRWPLSAGGAAALLTAIALGAGAILYVAGIKTDVAVVSTRVDAMQKSHDTDTTTLREEIRRVESALDARLNRLLELLPGRRDAKPQSR